MARKYIFRVVERIESLTTYTIESESLTDAVGLVIDGVAGGDIKLLEDYRDVVWLDPEFCTVDGENCDDDEVSKAGELLDAPDDILHAIRHWAKENKLDTSHEVWKRVDNYLGRYEEPVR